jgi:CNT family concentrative nucleoside transporter
MMLIAWSISSDKRRMNFRLIISGVTIQFIFAVLIIKTAPGKMLFSGARFVVAKIIGFSDEGAAFVFGPGFREHFFAFSVLPTIIFVSAVMAVLFHLGVMQIIVKGIAKVMVWIMDTSGSESLAAAANIFIGQTEAPLVIKPYIETMTSSELMAMMTSGMATVAGGVMAAYAGLGADAGHLLAASIMSAPASLVIAKIIIPEKEVSPTKGVVKLDIPKKDSNVLDAACRGASEGLKLALNVAAMLIAFIAIIGLLNGKILNPQFNNPIIAINAINIAATFNASFNPSEAPRHAASSTFESFFGISNFTTPLVGETSFSGIMILAITNEAGADIIDAARR